VSLLFAGDVLIHGPVARAAERADGTYDFDPMFEPVTPIVSAADVAICHMETPIDDDNADISSYPSFNAPREIAADLADAGFDGCSTASNHSLDKAVKGITTTLDALDAAGLKHAGTGRSQEEAARAALYEVRGVTIAHLSYSYETKGAPLPSAAPWSLNLIDPARVAADAGAAREAGADVVVVSLHWGIEYQQAVTAEQDVVASAVASGGAVDLVVGHHAHVPQPIGKVGGRWVLFGLGNFLSNQSAACCHPASQDGVIVRVNFVVAGSVAGARAGGGAKVEGVVYTPTRVDREGGFRVIPVGEALKAPHLAGQISAHELGASYLRTTSVVASDPTLGIEPSVPLG